MPRRVWIVCLMLALLPLRGWAAASMAMPEPAMASAAHAWHADAEAHAAVSPCHEAASDDASTTAHACNLCDLCHGAVADLATPALTHLRLPGVTPRPTLARDTGRPAVGGLERPPRTHLA
jgi:hypothetical protein